MLDQIISYYEEEKKLIVRKMNKHCNEYFAYKAIKISKILDALYAIKQDGIFK